VEELLARGAKVLASRRVITLRLLEDAAPSLASGDAALNPRHELLLFPQQTPDPFLVVRVHFSG
jgi:hypothetical protein